MKARVFKYAKRYQGEAKTSDFQLVEEELKTLEDDEILCEAHFWSVEEEKKMDFFPLTLLEGERAEDGR
uniref:Uncharacterized protein n=1 Tax=Phlebotomus papatasi TaxID=29031 RepID=A0A1B0DIG8_PHLPP